MKIFGRRKKGTPVEIYLLEVDFIEDEVKEAVFGSCAERALYHMVLLFSFTRPFGK